MVAEADYERTDAGLAPAGPGWFVLNGREARWNRRPGRGFSLCFTGATDEECETHFAQVGVNVFVLGPGEPIGMYHWEADAEEFLVLSGEALLLIEGQERPLRPWDFVHCPPGTRHMILGSGSGPCAVLAVGGRAHIKEPCNGGAYVVDEAARRHGACAAVETSDARLAYAHCPPNEAVPFDDDWLPGR